MAKRSHRRFQLLVDVSIVNGSWSSLADLMEYIRFRLNLRSRETDNLTLNEVCLIRECEEQKEMDI